jgi:putative ABC transport system ATP-binding protein
MIRLRNVHVMFSPGTSTQKHALRGVDLDIREGEFVTVIGSNGAGKSTLLGLLSGEVRASSGDLSIDEVDVTSQSQHARAKLVARVFQDPLAGTCATLTIEENLALAARRGARRGVRFAIDAGDRHRFAQVLEPLGLGLEQRMRTQIGLLSGGQRQAVSLLMASLSGSRLLLLDEHTAALDPGTAELVLSITRKIVEQARLTTLMVTHSMRQALDFGGRTLMLDGGRIALDVCGAQRDVLDVPALLGLFSKASHKVLDEDRLLAA